MTKREACEFFYRHGNVGMRTVPESVAIDDLMHNQPTPGQLRDACVTALRRGQYPSIIGDAWEAIMTPDPKELR